MIPSIRFVYASCWETGLCPQNNGLPGGGFCALATAAFQKKRESHMIRKGKIVLLGVITVAALVIVSRLAARAIISF